MLIREQAPLTQPAASTATSSIPPTREEPSVVRSSFEVGSSSAPRGSSPARPAHDVVSVRLARVLAEHESDLPVHKKGISIGEGNSKGANPSTPELREETTILKQKIIKKDLQIENLNS